MLPGSVTTLPTMLESGVKDFVVSIWIGIVVPRAFYLGRLGALRDRMCPVFVGEARHLDHVVVDHADVGYALETQTRPLYSPGFFGNGDRELRVVIFPG